MEDALRLGGLLCYNTERPGSVDVNQKINLVWPKGRTIYVHRIELVSVNHSWVM